MGPMLKGFAPPIPATRSGFAPGLTGRWFGDRESITMKTATVADLRNDFATLSKWIHEGEAITITKRGRPFAILAPARKRKTLPSVNRLARLHKIFPAGPIPTDARDAVDQDRGDR
jgi:prevent-host-death family protein